MFPYSWKISDGYPAKGIEHHGTTVMTTFACGGGSSMGYKLAGYDVVAANDIDPEMAKVYKLNHNPAQFFLCSAKELLERDDLPQVDILDGSPPCSVFSMAGSREDAWQEDKMFREGQAKQVLDDLFFDFIDLVEKMQPKVAVAENVKGMLIGHAKWYTREVTRRFKAIGYNCQVFLLNSASMGLPQARERVFFIASKGDKKLALSFNEPSIPFSKVHDETDTTPTLTKLEYDYWKQAAPGQSVGKFMSNRKLNPHKAANTVVSSSELYHHQVPRKINKLELCRLGSWPLDYNFDSIRPKYLVGMSVPPIMMAQVAHQIYRQLIK